MARPDPWLVEHGLVLRADEAAFVAELCDEALRVRASRGQSLRTRRHAGALAALRTIAAVHRRNAAMFVGEHVDGGDAADAAVSPHDQEITADRAAEALGVTVQTVTRLCREGDLSGRQLGRRWLVDVASVAERLERAG